MDNRRSDELEERLAHLQKVTEELSDVVAQQARDITLLTRRVAMLMEREAIRDADAGESVPLADQRPPHW